MARGFANSMERQFAKWGDRVTVGSGAIAVAGYLGGLLDDVQDFPLGFKLAVYVGGGIFLLVVALRFAFWVRHRNSSSAERPIKQTVVHMGPGASMGRGRVERNVMSVSLGDARAPRRRVVRLTEAQQKDLAARGRNLADRITAFVAERHLAERRVAMLHRHPSLEASEEERDRAWDQHMEEIDSESAESDADYQRRFAGEIAEYLDEAVESRFDLGWELRRHADRGAPLRPEEAARLIRVLAGRIDRYTPPWWWRWWSRLTRRDQEGQP